MTPARRSYGNVPTFPAYRWRSDEAWDTIPYSNHPYAYALSNPVLYTDPTGKYFDDGDGGYGYDKEYRNCQQIGGSWNWQQGLCYVDLRPSKPGLGFLEPARNATQYQQCPHGTIEHEAPDRVRYCVPIGMPQLLPEPSWWQTVQQTCATIWDGVPNIVFATDGKQNDGNSSSASSPGPSSPTGTDPSKFKEIMDRIRAQGKLLEPSRARVTNPNVQPELQVTDGSRRFNVVAGQEYLWVIDDNGRLFPRVAQRASGRRG